MKKVLILALLLMGLMLLTGAEYNDLRRSVTCYAIPESDVLNVKCGVDGGTCFMKNFWRWYDKLDYDVMLEFTTTTGKVVHNSYHKLSMGYTTSFCERIGNLPNEIVVREYDVFGEFMRKGRTIVEGENI